jgi:rod shape-determining protein MreD
VTVTVALYDTPRNGMWAGVLAGFLQDIAAGRLIGLNTVTLAGIGYLTAWAGQQVAKDPIFVPGLLAAMAQVVASMFEWTVLRLFGLGVSWSTFMHPLAAWVLFSMFLTPALGGILGLSTRRDRYENGRGIR